MHSRFLIRLENYISIIFGLQTQCGLIFSPIVVKKYGRTLKILTQYYQPRRISKIASFRYLKQLNWNLTEGKALGMLKQALRTRQFLMETRMSRIYNPAGDSYVLAQFFVYITTRYNFSQFVNRISNTAVYRLLTNTNETLRYRPQILGLEMSLHGRVPREPVRARKTIQSRTLGRPSVNITHKFLVNKADGINAELGTFSF